MSFLLLNLNPDVTKAITACGYSEPTPIQARSIPEILAGKDLVASAQTGTGKTAAFVLPALHQLSLKKAGSKPRVLILTPTRELAAQITDAAKKYGKFLRFNIVSVVGGMPYRQQLKELSRVADIIVATPGRLMDHMQSGRVDLSEIEMLVLDEADRMLDMGFIDDVKIIAAETPEERQTLLFSATVDKRLTQIIRQLLKDPMHIDLSHEKLAPAKIKQELYLADNTQHKTQILLHLLQNNNMYKGIIFSATKLNADQLADQLCDAGFEAEPLHGDLKQNMRNRTIEKLRRGSIQFIVATDVASRGIDISDLTHVINYDLPKFSEDYVHRIGRTGRAGKEGIAISLAAPMDARHIQRIERYIKEQLPRVEIPGLEPKKNAQSGRNGPNKKKPRSFSSNGPRRSDDARPFKGNRSSQSGDWKKSKPRSESGEGRSSDRGSFGSRDSRPERGSFAGKEGRSSDRGGFGGRDSRPERGSFAGREGRSSDRGGFGSKAARPGSDRGGFGGKEGRSFTSKTARPERASFGSKEGRSERGSFAGKGKEGRSVPVSFGSKPARSERGEFVKKKAKAQPQAVG